ncbi:hypothetical protein TrLO_g9377 [Triparma laevis f. longispina]|uniref:Uncharacterized protein n=1 Tax=Triparma laevis f. longispina TaxID=1714387 RepID=A0A9W7FR04_9STRA|nr:hypothetical protein TrLO_g9377 [Triparma laevis f. longispina]
MTFSAPAETNPCPDLMHNNIHSHPSSFKKYLYESILKGRESSHTHAIGFKLTGIEETLRKEIEVIKLYLRELEVARAYIKDNMTHSPSPLPQSSKPWSNLPVKEPSDLFSRSTPFYQNVVLPAVYDDVNFQMTELNTLISLMCRILIDMDKIEHEMTVKPPQLFTRRHYASYVKSLHTSKTRITTPPQVSSRPPPTYPYLYDLTRSITNVLDVGGFRHYVEGTSCNVESFLGDAIKKGLVSESEPDPNFLPWWPQYGYGQGDYDHSFDYCSISPVHYQNFLNDPTIISNFEANGESTHPDFYPDYQTHVDWTGSMLTNGAPAGLGKSIVPLFGEVVVPDFNFKWELSTSYLQEHKFTPASNVHGVRTAAVCGGLTIPTSITSPPCSGMGIGGVIGRIMTKSSEKARSRRLRYLILMVRGHAIHRMQGRKKKKKKTTTGKKKRPRSSSNNDSILHFNSQGSVLNSSAFEKATSFIPPIRSTILNHVVRPVFDFFNVNVPASLLEPLGGLDRIGVDPNDPYNQHELPEFILRDRIMTMFFSPLTCPLARRDRPVSGVELGSQFYESNLLEVRPNPILEIAERLLFDVMPLLLADITLLAQSDRVALQHMHLLRSKIDGLCEPYLNSIADQRGSVLSMSGTNWAAKYKGMSTPHRKDAQKDALERLQGLMTSLSLGEIKTAKSSNPVNGLSDWLATSEEDSEDSRMDATTSLPLVFAAEKEIVEIEKEIEKQLSSAVDVSKTMLVQTGAPKSAWYKAEGTPAGSRIVYEGESQAESSADDPVCKPPATKIRLQNPFDLSKMPSDSKTPVRVEMDQWDARDVMGGLQRLVKGDVRSLLTSLLSVDNYEPEISDFTRRIDLLVGLVASRSIVTDSGTPIQFPEAVVKHLFTVYDTAYLKALMTDWCVAVSRQRLLAAASSDIIFKIRVTESELIFLNKSFETGPTERNGAAAKEEELVRSEVKAKFDAMNKGLQEMNWSETGTRLHLNQMSIHEQNPTPEEFEQKAQIEERLRQLWGWSNNGTL